MAVVYHEIYLPIDTESTFDYIVIKQGDAGTHKVRATLISNNRVYTIPTSGSTYWMKFRKPDNNYCLVEATVSDNTISAEVTEEMLRVSGTGRGEFMIVSGSTELKTATFYVKIVRETYTSEDVQSHSDFAPFAALLAGAGAATSNANTAAAAAMAAAELAEQKAEAIPDDYSDLVAEVEEVKTELDNLEPGLSDAAKAALLNCFNHVAWQNGVGMEYYDELEEALGSAIRIDSSELKRGVYSNNYPYFVSDQNRLVYVGTKIETTPGCQYRVEFKNNTTDSIDVGVYAFDGSTLEKVQNQETISVAGGDNQGWQLSNYTFIAGNGQKLVWISFRKNAGDVPIIASDISDVKISRIGKPGIMTASYQEILVSEQYHANHTSQRSLNEALSVYRHIDGEINYQNCPVNKIKLKALSTGVITIGKIKKSDAVEGNPGDLSLAHRKVTVQITETGEQEIEFEGFPVADDEYVCMGFNSWDDSDKTKTTAKWTYGQRSTDRGYMYMQIAEPHKWVFWTGGTGNGINLYIRKRVYS